MTRTYKPKPRRKREPKEIPIIYSAAMIRAIMEGRKIVTRRLVKNPPILPEQLDGTIENWKPAFIDAWSPWRPGDILWAKETFSVLELVSENNAERKIDTCILYPATYEQNPQSSKRWLVINREDAPKVIMKNEGKKIDTAKLIPAIFLPRVCSRIWQAVESVRIERLQEITQEDAKREGVFPRPHRCPGWENELLSFSDCYRCSYKFLWNTINGPGGHGWDQNPWVWAITFKTLSTDGKEKLGNNS